MTPAGGARALFGSPRFLVLWAAMLISSTGTFFLLLTVSARLLDQHGSGLSASAVFGFQWILPILLVTTVRRACEGARLRRTVVCVELGGGLVSLTIGVLLQHGLVAAVLGCFLVRGLLEGITKTARVVYARRLFDGPTLKLASYTFNNSYYLGSALGGVLGSLLAGHVSVETAAAVDASTFVVSACCYRWLPQVSAPRAATARSDEPSRLGLRRQIAGVLRGRPGLTRAVVYLIVAVGAFQGFHSTARTVVPIRVLHLGDASVMHLQIVCGLALVLGAIAVPVLLRRMAPGRRLGLAANTATAGAMVLLPYASGPLTLFAAYFGYLFLFEFAFTAAQAEIIQDCPPSELVLLTSFTNATGNGLLVLCTLLTGGLSDVMDFRLVALLLAVLAAGAGLVAEVRVRRQVAIAAPVAASALRRPPLARTDAS
ncbi:putative MFS family arabinose efflux permease [Kitasatospora sp. MAP12-15]|uniref:MFS transporter n=1 Tax=unclassified Kitasatospora TaxID=2633591 RepID=UPI002475DBFB|nr:MFS transporter [Kitasatospora sp. MAP12-44]MDH6113896.1 putative MFS family arabinose efflux permease [Kitasatospora sp. MAP12-44]